MNFIRTLASGKRNRFKDGDFDLDLTYITPRIIAMSYPSDGVESVYRNHIQDVSRFLNRKHAERYMIFNLSERHYENAMFGHRVVSLGFPDHHAPPVEVAWTLCLTIHAWLSADPAHVVVVHCLAGKGRTGAIIACYMLFAGLWTTEQRTVPTAPGSGKLHTVFLLPSPSTLAKTVLHKFRTARGEGVKYPSQERTVRYFARVVHAALVRAHNQLMIEKAFGPIPLPGGGAQVVIADDGTSNDEKAPLWILWQASEKVRDLKQLPMPHVQTLRVTRIIVSGLPPLQSMTVADAAFGAPPASPATFDPPLLAITTSPYQQAETRVLFNSAWHERDSIVYTPADPAVASAQAGPGSYNSGASGSYGITMYSLHTLLQGDVLLTCRAGSGVAAGAMTSKHGYDSSIKFGSTQEIFRASFHTGFVVHESAREGVYRLSRLDVDQDKRSKQSYPLHESEFFCDIFYTVLSAQEAAALAAKTGASSGITPGERSVLGHGHSPSSKQHLHAQPSEGAHASHAHTTTVAQLKHASSALDSPSAAASSVRSAGLSQARTAFEANVPVAAGVRHDAGILAAGWLQKRGHLVRNWKKRYFVLRKVSALDSGHAPPWADALPSMKAAGLMPSSDPVPGTGPSDGLATGAAALASSARDVASSVAKGAMEALSSAKGLMSKRRNSTVVLGEQAGGGQGGEEGDDDQEDDGIEDEEDGLGAESITSLGAPVAYLCYFKSPGHAVPKGILPIYASTRVLSVDEVLSSSTSSSSASAGSPASAASGSSSHASTAALAQRFSGAAGGRKHVFVLERPSVAADSVKRGSPEPSQRRSQTPGSASTGTGDAGHGDDPERRSSRALSEGVAQQSEHGEGTEPHSETTGRASPSLSQAQAASGSPSTPGGSFPAGARAGRRGSAMGKLLHAAVNMAQQAAGAAPSADAAGARRLYLQADCAADLSLWLSAISNIFAGGPSSAAESQVAPARGAIDSLGSAAGFHASSPVRDSYADNPFGNPS